MNVIIIGAGPVGCFTALEFAKRGIDVTIYEKSIDYRNKPARTGRSFNLTLSYRGLSNLDTELVSALYTKGVPLPQRVIHHLDKTVSYQPYGLSEDNHILSIPRKVVSDLLLDKVEQAGITVYFKHETVKVNAVKGTATVLTSKGIKKLKADLIIGCDGSNSIVRNEIFKKENGAMYIHKAPATHGYVELNMPKTASNAHTLIEKMADENSSESKLHGMHVWPRNNFMLLSQPNIDKTYTTTLFMPMESEDENKPSFQYIKNNEDVEKLFKTYFPDALEHMPSLYEDFFKHKVSRLKTIKCAPFHSGKCVLFGDAAHTMVPFYGQGINCGFEDVGQFFTLFDTYEVVNDFEATIPKVFEEYSKKRGLSCSAINELSEYNLHELAKNIEDKNILAKRKIENELHKRYPEKFIPLYYSVAFTSTPYEVVVEQYKKRSQLLDEICRFKNVSTQKESIIETYIAQCDAEKTSTINLPIKESRDLIQTSMNYLFDYFKELETGKHPVSYVHDSDNTSRYIAGKEASVKLKEYVPPKEGQDFRVLLDEVFSTVIKNGTVHTHPGFMAHVPSGGLFQSAVAEFITRALNRFVSVWIASPGLVQIESNVIHWFCNILGYDSKAFGYLTTSGSLSNFMGVLCAKNQQGNASIDKYVIYTSTQSHFCIAKAAKMAGLTNNQIRLVEVEDDLTMSIDNLIEVIERDKSLGFIPLCIVATAGTTNTGTVDDLKRIHHYCQEQNIWLHVDACLGGFFSITKRGKQLLQGIELADSIAVDAHKSLFLPHGTAAILVKDKKKLRDTFEIPNSSYMPGFSREDEMVDFCNYGPELSRETRGLSVWFPMKMHGLRGFEQCLDEKLDLAILLSNSLKDMNHIEVLEFNTCLPIVVFKVKSFYDVNENKLNRDLCEIICAKGNTYITTTELPNVGVVNRVCILHSKTNKAIIEQCVNDIEMSINMLKEKVGNYAELV